MTILNEGLNRIRDLLFDDINKGQLGESGTAPQASDTGLGTAVSSTLLAVDTKTKTDKQLKIDYILPSTGGTSTTFKEFELQRSTATTVNYDRIVFTGIDFTQNGTQDLIISKKYFFRSV